MYIFLQSLNNILTKKERLKLFGISLMLTFLALIEVAGLALISFIIVNLDTLDLVLKSSKIYLSLSNFLLLSSFSPSLVFCSFVILYSICTAISSISVIKYVSRYSQLIGVNIKSKVIEKLLLMDWNTISQLSPSENISRIVNDSEQAADAIYFSMHLFSKSVLAFFIVNLLFIFNTQITLIFVGLLGSTYLLLYKYFDIATKSNSLAAAKSKDLIIKSVKNMIGSIKEIIFYKNSSHVLQNISKHNLSYAHVRGENMAYAQLPRFFIDSLLLISLVFILLYMQLSGSSPILFFSTISIFGIAGLKLLPAFQNIFYFGHEINTRSAHVRNISEILKTKIESMQRIQKIPSFEEQLKTIEFKNVSFRYGASASLAINNLSTTINTGEKIILFGPSGSGKSTFIDILLGLIEPQEGKVLVNNNIIHSNSLMLLREKFAYVPQKIYFLEATLAENLNFGSSNINNTQTYFQNFLRDPHFQKLVSTLPAGMETTISDENQMVSGGQKQLVGIARALNRGGEILILDESSSAMDDDLEKKVLEYIFNSNFQTIIAVSHKSSILKHFDKIFLFKDGKIVDTGNFDHLIKNEFFKQSLEE
ncbi:ABC transporter ATP-binding protein/permease [Gammaproteobacteria bacterium]|nr:ABC transporter ATP-binding protein/permease [Gammaproteobacteria bacterium]